MREKEKMRGVQAQEEATRLFSKQELGYLQGLFD